MSSEPDQQPGVAVDVDQFDISAETGGVLLRQRHGEPQDHDGCDRFLWLEDISRKDSLEWVRQHSHSAVSELSGERFDEMRATGLEVLDTDTRIPYVARRGEYLYNIWRDAQHPRGLWRRTTLEQYRTDAPEWDVLIDLDALAAAENENWVWAGANVIRPERTRVLMLLSRGGGDAVLVREFDMTTRQFVVDGFTLPKAKTSISWEDEDTCWSAPTSVKDR